MRHTCHLHSASTPRPTHLSGLCTATQAVTRRKELTQLYKCTVLVQIQQSNAINTGGAGDHVHARAGGRSFVCLGVQLFLLPSGHCLQSLSWISFSCQPCFLTRHAEEDGHFIICAGAQCWGDPHPVIFFPTQDLVTEMSPGKINSQGFLFRGTPLCFNNTGRGKIVKQVSWCVGSWQHHLLGGDSHKAGGEESWDIWPGTGLYLVCQTKCYTFTLHIYANKF